MSEGLQAEMTLQESCLDAMRHMSVEVGALIDKTNELEDENAKLREELAKWERLTAGIDLPEYPVTQFEPKDLERENAELQELCMDMMSHLREAERIHGDYLLPDGYIARMRELGIEYEE